MGRWDQFGKRSFAAEGRCYNKYLKKGFLFIFYLLFCYRRIIICGSLEGLPSSTGKTSILAWIIRIAGVIRICIVVVTVSLLLRGIVLVLIHQRAMISQCIDLLWQGEGDPVK